MTASPDLRALLMAGIRAADPAAAVRRVVTRTEAGISVGGHFLPVAEHLAVLALGKAAPAMVMGLDEAVPDLTLHGLEVAFSGSSGRRGIVTLHGSHPVPDLRSVIAGRRLLATAAVTPPGMSTVVLVSGGGSSLAEAPAAGVSLDDITRITARLLESGADIEEINTIRRHLSRLKGGRLGAALRGPFVTVAISDVVGSPPHAIASGPTVPDPTGAADAVAVAERHGFRLPVTPVDDPPVMANAPFVVAADGAVAADAVAGAAAASGFAVQIHTTELTGDAATAARHAIERTEPGSLGVFAGETTVEVTGDGVGGRNQHAALAAALVVEGGEVRFAAIGTDGIDGNSPAAGAVVDGTTCARLESAGRNPAASLQRHDSHGALDSIGATVVTGPTGTNVGDLWIVDRTSG